MTAGRGITHSERFERARREGGRIDGIQASVALPQVDEDGDPAFAHYGANDLPIFEENGVWGRLVAGKALGLHADVETHSPMFYIHWQLSAGARAELPAEYPERAIYVAAGRVEVEGQTFEQGEMLVFDNYRVDLPSVTLTLRSGVAIRAEPGDRR